MEENGIGQHGATALAEALVVNRGAESLHLSENAIGDAGATSMGNALSLNAKLVTLWLGGGNNIGVAGGAALSDALKHNSTLKTLHLGSPRVGHAVGIIASLFPILCQKNSDASCCLPSQVHVFP